VDVAVLSLYTLSCLDELVREFGSGVGIDFRSKIDTIEKPYYFIKFG
jgi:hypothetical protein